MKSRSIRRPGSFSNFSRTMATLPTMLPMLAGSSTTSSNRSTNLSPLSKFIKAAAPPSSLFMRRWYSKRRG